MESEHESFVVSCLHVVFLTFLLSQFFVLRIYKTKAVKWTYLKNIKLTEYVISNS